MKKLFVSVLLGFIAYCFIVNSEFRNSTIEEFSNVKEKIDNVIGGGETKKVIKSNKPSKFDFEQSSKGHSDEAISYFNEICYGSEFNKTGKIHKWSDDVKIYVVGDKRSYLIEELNNIVYELNNIINPIDIKIVNNRADANYIIYLCSADEYVSAEPSVKNLVQTNWGLFSAKSRGERIISGTMYVDIYRCQSILAQKHLLREELTQSLGFMNDSYTYPNSMFYQGWTETTSYAQIDIEIIDILYN